jgi:hypothetical protein
METVGPPPADVELHLLTEWGDPAAPKRMGEAAVLSVLAHIAVIVLLALCRRMFWRPGGPARERAHRHTAGGTATELTQPNPNKGKLSKQITAPGHQAQIQTVARLLTRSSPRRPALCLPPAIAPRQRPRPEPPPRRGCAEALPAARAGRPQIQTVEKPKLTLENVGVRLPWFSGAGPRGYPNTLVADAIHRRAPALRGGMMATRAGREGMAGINLPPYSVRSSALNWCDPGRGFPAHSQILLPSGAPARRCRRA